MKLSDSVSSAFAAALNREKWPENAHFILAVSGGVDSMIAGHLFATHSSFPVTWAHVNFGLRGAESDGDAFFVEQEGARYGVDVHVNAPDTRVHAKTHGVSIQMAARELRYDFFNALADAIRAKGFVPVVVTAHHADDQAETLLQNLARGKHPLSWSGMESGLSRAFRPLLSIRKSELLEYARQHHIAYREDASNSSDHYQRNFVRHRIIPLFEELNPSAVPHLNEAAEEAGRWLELAQKGAQHLVESTGTPTPEGMAWTLSALREPSGSLAFELHLIALGFPDLTALREQLKNPRTGAILEWTGHELLFDRERIILREKNPDPPTLEKHKSAEQTGATKTSTRSTMGLRQSSSGQPNTTRNTVHNAEQLTWKSAEALTGAKTITIGEEEWEVTRVTESQLTSPELGKTACIFDADQLEYPAVLRKWQPGDRITPLGLGGEQKVKDILINRKVNRFAKEQTWVLADQRNVACILFHTLSERTKVTPESVRIVQIRRR